MYVTPVMLVSFSLNIPKFMENKSTPDNVTGDHRPTASDMRLNPTYMLYYTISQIFHPTMTTSIIPMVALIFMNTSIFFGIQQTMRARNQRRNPNAPYGSSQNLEGSRDSNSETNLAVVLVGITTSHLLCHALRVFLAIYAVYVIRDTISCTSSSGFVPPLWAMVSESVSSLLVMINFSGNFLIYCSTLKPFRAYLARWCSVCTKAGSRNAARSAGEAVEMGAQTNKTATTGTTTPATNATNGIEAGTTGPYLNVPQTTAAAAGISALPSSSTNGTKATLLVVQDGDEESERISLDDDCKTITIQVGTAPLLSKKLKKTLWQKILLRSSNSASSSSSAVCPDDSSEGDTLIRNGHDGLTAERLQKYRQDATDSKRRQLVNKSVKAQHTCHLGPDVVSSASDKEENKPFIQETEGESNEVEKQQQQAPLPDKLARKEPNTKDGFSQT